MNARYLGRTPDYWALTLMREHAITYTFDRLKVSIILIILYIMTLDSLKSVKSEIIYFISGISILIIMVFGIITYGHKKIVNLPEMRDTVILKDYIQNNYQKQENILVKKDGELGDFFKLYITKIYIVLIYIRMRCLKISPNEIISTA